MPASTQRGADSQHKVLANFRNGEQFPWRARAAFTANF